MTQHQEYISSSSSKTRPASLKSPPSQQNLLDSKQYKKKYQQKVEQLIKQRQRTLQLQQMIQQMKHKLQKQQKQLKKKQQIQDVLLSQINQLKTQIQSNTSVSKQNSIEDKKIRKKQPTRSQCEGKNNQKCSSPCMYNHSDNSSSAYGYRSQYNSTFNNTGHKSLSSNQDNNQSSQKPKSQVGGYFASLFTQ